MRTDKRIAWMWPTLISLVVASLCVTAVVLAHVHGRPQPTSGGDEETEDRVAVSHQLCLHSSYTTPAGKSWQINAPTYEACAVGCKDNGYEVFEYIDHDDSAQAACLCKSKQDMVLKKSENGNSKSGFYTTGTSCGTPIEGGDVKVREADMDLGGVGEV